MRSRVTTSPSSGVCQPIRIPTVEEGPALRAFRTRTNPPRTSANASPSTSPKRVNANSNLVISPATALARAKAALTHARQNRHYLGPWERWADCEHIARTASLRSNVRNGSKADTRLMSISVGSEHFGMLKLRKSLIGDLARKQSLAAEHKGCAFWSDGQA